jgi:hypothetical protein
MWGSVWNAEATEVMIKRCKNGLAEERKQGKFVKYL